MWLLEGTIRKTKEVTREPRCSLLTPRLQDAVCYVYYCLMGGEFSSWEDLSVACKVSPCSHLSSLLSRGAGELQNIRCLEAKAPETHSAASVQPRARLKEDTDQTFGQVCRGQCLQQKDASFCMFSVISCCISCLYWPCALSLDSGISCAGLFPVFASISIPCQLQRLLVIFCWKSWTKELHLHQCYMSIFPFLSHIAPQGEQWRIIPKHWAEVLSSWENRSEHGTWLCAILLCNRKYYLVPM